MLPRVARIGTSVRSAYEGCRDFDFTKTQPGDELIELVKRGKVCEDNDVVGWTARSEVASMFECEPGRREGEFVDWRIRYCILPRAPGLFCSQRAGRDRPQSGDRYFDFKIAKPGDDAFGRGCSLDNATVSTRSFA